MMKSTYTIEKKDRYLHMTISGEYNRIEFLSYPKILLDECEKAKIYKILFDASRLKGTNVPTQDRLIMGEEIAKVLGSKIKLAAAWPPADIDHFVEVVAVNRGARIFVHGDVNVGKNWLLSGD